MHDIALPMPEAVIGRELEEGLWRALLEEGPPPESAEEVWDWEVVPDLYLRDIHGRSNSKRVEVGKAKSTRVAHF